MQTYTVAQVLKSEAFFEDMVHLLDLSFTTDTLTNWLFKNSSHEDYLQKLTYYHRCVLRLALLSGASVIVISDDSQTASSQKTTNLPSRSGMKALAVLTPPSGNKKFESPFTQIRAGILSLAWQGGWSVISSLFLEFLPKLNTMIAGLYPAPNEHKRHEQWHLLFLATRPDCQGQGLGKKLLLECQRVVTEVALENKMLGKEAGPLHLESTTLGSKRLYNRMGFIDRGEMTYGECKEGETVTTDENGKVVGGRLFALTLDAMIQS